MAEKQRKKSQENESGKRERVRKNSRSPHRLLSRLGRLTGPLTNRQRELTNGLDFLTGPENGSGFLALNAANLSSEPLFRASLQSVQSLSSVSSEPLYSKSLMIWYPEVSGGCTFQRRNSLPRAIPAASPGTLWTKLRGKLLVFEYPELKISLRKPSILVHTKSFQTV